MTSGLLARLAPLTGSNPFYLLRVMSPAKAAAAVPRRRADTLAKARAKRRRKTALSDMEKLVKRGVEKAADGEVISAERLQVIADRNGWKAGGELARRQILDSVVAIAAYTRPTEVVRHFAVGDIVKAGKPPIDRTQHARVDTNDGFAEVWQADMLFMPAKDYPRGMNGGYTGAVIGTQNLSGRIRIVPTKNKSSKEFERAIRTMFVEMV